MPLTDPWLIYGAYGFTGRLITRAAVEAGHRPVVAGRDRERLRAVAEEHGLAREAVALDDAAGLRDVLGPVEAVVHAAGPFSGTWRPMADACLATGTHYLDITGEVEVFEALRPLDARARDAGVVLLPGVGFDVVATDCLAARLAAAVPEATRLLLAFHSTGSPSRGTARSMVEALRRPPLERAGGVIRPLPEGTDTLAVPFTDRERSAIAVTWGDVSTAYHSTGIPDVRTYATAPPGAARWYRLAVRARPVLALASVQSLLKWLVERLVENPEPGGGHSRVWGRAADDDGSSATGELVTPGGYAFTARSAVAAVERLLSGETSDRDRGFLTPSLAFGPGFVDELPGVSWVRRPPPPDESSKSAPSR